MPVKVGESMSSRKSSDGDRPSISTVSDDFPAVSAYQSAVAGQQDAFLAKIDATGTSIIYSTLLGGSWDDNAHAVAVDANGIAYIAGKRDWARHYQVKLNLVNNPKLPLAKALRLLPFLYPKDLRKLSANRNVSHTLARQAKDLYRKRSRRSGGR